ncbi:MAG: MFS transporter [Phycisphaerales bacterium]
MGIYPLRGLPNQKQIWSWISFDVANQSFTLIINTLLFSKYFMDVVLGPDATDRNIKWSLVFTVSMLLTVVASPIAGAIADGRSWKKRCLLFTGFGCALLTCGLGLVGPGDLWLAVLIYVPANFLFNIGENFLASFLPELGKREDFGRLSGFSWGVAYFAALMLLVITVVSMDLFKLEPVEAWRPFFVFAGAWFFVFAVPTMLFLREAPAPAGTGENLLLAGFKRLAETIREIRKYRDLAVLLVASFFYGIAMQVIIAFASKITSDYGFESVEMVLFVAVMTISGIIGTLIPTLYQDRLGHRNTTVALICVWIVVCLLFAGYTWARGHSPDPSAYPLWPIWILGNMIGFGLGSLGAANRAFVGFLTPPERTAECFGLWGLVFKLAAVGTIPFALARDRLGDPASFLLLGGFLVIGLVLTLAVKERRAV